MNKLNRKGLVVVTVVTIVMIGIFMGFELDNGSSNEVKNQPNIVIIFTDDMGYGDLGVFGHPTIATPHLDQLAAEGQKWTQFYVPHTVCTPSRTALLTGRKPIRIGNGTTRVMFEYHRETGLPPDVFTIGDLLSEAGYSTATIGKWHLGHMPDFLPTNHGFDTYYGVPYSNDMRVDPQMMVADDILFREGMTLERMRDPEEQVRDWVPLMRDEKVIEYPVDQSTLTKRYTDEAVRFIEEHQDEPFFVYLAHTFPHIPLFASEEQLEHASRRGLYGDTIEEIDSSTGRVIQTIKRLGLEDNTFVIFTSDNGPWLSYHLEGGDPGPLTGGKGSLWEGGVRVPTIVWWPGQIEAGSTVMELGSTLDLLPTISTLVDGAEIPGDIFLDGYDISASMLNGEPSPRETLFFYHVDEVYAVRHGKFKVHYKNNNIWDNPGPSGAYDSPLLFHLEHDPAEKFDIADKHPDVLEKIHRLLQEHQSTID